MLKFNYVPTDNGVEILDKIKLILHFVTSLLISISQ